MVQGVELRGVESYSIILDDKRLLWSCYDTVETVQRLSLAECQHAIQGHTL